MYMHLLICLVLSAAIGKWYTITSDDLLKTQYLSKGYLHEVARGAATRDLPPSICTHQSIAAMAKPNGKELLPRAPWRLLVFHRVKAVPSLPCLVAAERTAR